MSTWLCSIKAMLRKRMEVKDPVHRKEIAMKVKKLAHNWDKGKGYENVKDMNWNNFETFQWLYEKYTHKPFDPVEFPTNFKDVRKLEVGLKYYNNLISKPKGFIAAKFHIPRVALKNVPELLRFETDIINQTQYHRSYSNESNKKVNDMLQTFKDFTLSLGNSKFRFFKNFGSAGQKELRTLYNEYSNLSQAFKATKDPVIRAKLSNKLRINRTKIVRFYESGSGEAFKILNSILQGADPETITTSDGKPLNNHQKTLVQNMVTNYQGIRKLGVVNLINGLQQIKKNAKDKNLVWVEGVVEKINGLIKQIEFQHMVDTNGKLVKYRDLGNERDFIALGFKKGVESHNGQVAFSKHYMSQYTLGLLKTIKVLESSVENGDITSPKDLIKELNSWDGIANVAKGRQELSNPVYDMDPYFFLKKYVSDVGIFNYKTHVKTTFKKAVDVLINEHLKPAERSGKQNLIDSATSMIDSMREVYRDIQLKDPTKESYSTDLMRIMTGFTYFRLMGGNVRSAARNWTQRFIEFTEFGLKAKIDASRFYRSSGSGEANKVKVGRQIQLYGLQWFDGKSVSSSLLNKLSENKNVSQSTRGALEEAHTADRHLYVDSKGELQIYTPDRVTEKIARNVGGVAQFFGTGHRIVEDFNRTGTFRVGFALAHQNIQNTSNSWKARQILTQKQIDKIKQVKGKDHQIGYEDLLDVYGDKTLKTIDNWVEAKAGQIAYNGVLDVHFEYAKWNKARAIQITGEERIPTQLLKAGLGQFQHYRFNMMNLMWKWMKESGISIRAGDFTSSEAIKPLRYAMLQASIGAATIGTSMNFRRLMPNELQDYAEAMWTWMSSKRELLAEGELSPEMAENLNRATYGQGGWYFLGPNVGLGLDIYEFMSYYDANLSKDPRSQLPFTKSFNKIRGDLNQEQYEKWAIFNSQAARTWNYTLPMYGGGGSFMDVAMLELGLFPSKPQRELTTWLKQDVLGYKKKKRGRKRLRKYDEEAILESLNLF